MVSRLQLVENQERKGERQVKGCDEYVAGNS